MPDQEAGGAHPSDATGTAWTPPSGEPEGQSNIARSLGIQNAGEPSDTTDDESKGNEGETTEEETGEQPKTLGSKKALPKPGENKLVDKYGERIQQLAEEAYALDLDRVRKDPAYLDKLVQSNDPMDQRMATKLLSRNDFGAKTVDDYKRSLIVKNAGKDPRDQAIAELRMEVENLKSGTRSQDWASWKQQNAVSGEAETLADSVRAEYPSMSNADVLAFVRGKLGITHAPSQKEQMGYGRGGLGAVPQEDTPDLESPLARALLPKDIKATQKFGRQLLGRMRR